MQEMQRILSMRAEPHNGCEYDLTADTPERKCHKEKKPESPGAPKKKKSTVEAEQADEVERMERAWEETAREDMARAVHESRVTAGMSAGSRPRNFEEEEEENVFGHLRDGM